MEKINQHSKQTNEYDIYSLGLNQRLRKEANTSPQLSSHSSEYSLYRVYSLLYLHNASCSVSSYRLSAKYDTRNLYSYVENKCLHFLFT